MWPLLPPSLLSFPHPFPRKEEKEKRKLASHFPFIPSNILLKDSKKLSLKVSKKR